MQPKTPGTGDWPVIVNVMAPLAAWWRRRTAIRETMSDLDAFGPAEMARMAQDVGIPPSDLRELARHCSDAADLLERRVEALGMSTSELVKTAPAELRDLERLCTLCQSKGRCARDLIDDPSDPIWRQYCPNEETLVALAAEVVER
jgi:hypothetical protein